MNARPRVNLVMALLQLNPDENAGSRRRLDESRLTDLLPLAVNERSADGQRPLLPLGLSWAKAFALAHAVPSSAAPTSKIFPLMCLPPDKSLGNRVSVSMVPALRGEVDSLDVADQVQLGAYPLPRGRHIGPRSRLLGRRLVGCGMLEAFGDPMRHLILQ